jgi:hypothetical protein
MTQMAGSTWQLQQPTAKRMALGFGRNPDAAKVLRGNVPVLGKTPGQARAVETESGRLIHPGVPVSG